MKKILVIIILSLLWSGNSYSMQFINCYDASNIAFDPMKLPKELRSFSLDPTKDKKINNSVKTIDDFKKEAFLNYSEKYKIRKEDERITGEWRMLYRIAKSVGYSILYSADTDQFQLKEIDE